MRRLSEVFPALWRRCWWQGAPSAPPRFRPAALLTFLLTVVLLHGVGSAQAHEPWLLSPDEIAVIQQQPLPPLFTTVNPLTVALALLTVAVGAAAWWAQRRVARHAALVRLTERLRSQAGWSPLALRLGLSVLLLWSASKGALFFPELDVRDNGASWVVGSEVTLALLLAFDPSVWLPALLLLALEAYGLVVFRARLVPYLGIIAGPALYLVIRGGSLPSLWRVVDRASPLGKQVWMLPLRLLRVLTGTHFVAMGIACKYAAPGMFVTILLRDRVPTFGLAPEAVTLLLGTGEVALGAALTFGLLPRATAALLIGGFIAMTALLREDVWGHAIFIAVLLVLLIEGKDEAEEAPAVGAGAAPNEAARRGALKLMAPRRRLQPQPLAA